MLNFKKILTRNKVKLIIVFSAVLLFIGLANLYMVVNVRVTSNDECLWIQYNNDGKNIIKFEQVKKGGVTWNAGIRNGDLLLKINGKKITEPLQAQAILNKVESGKYADYTIQKGSEVKHTQVYVKKLINFPWLGLSLLGLIWMTIGFIVYMAKPEGTVQRLFYWIGVTFILSLLYLYVQSPPTINNLIFMGFIDFINTFALIFLPFLIIHFFWIFPKPFKFMRKKWTKRILYIIPLTVFILHYIYKLFILYPEAEKYRSTFGMIVQVLNFLFLGSLIIGLVSLIVNYFRLKNKEERKPLFVIVSSLTLGILSIFYFIFIAPLSGTIYNNPEVFTPVILIVLIPIAFGYSIFKYQLMDVSIVVKNAIIYGAATITIAASYFLVIYLIGQTISQAIGTQYQGIIAGVIFILFAVIFQSTKDKFQDFITAKFYPEQFAYQRVLIRFSTDVSSFVGLENILDAMTKTFVEALTIKHFGILLTQKDGNELVMVRKIGIRNENMSINNSDVMKFLDENSAISKYNIIEQHNFQEVFPDDYQQLIDEKIYTIIPMIIKSKLVGLLLFGLKHSGAQFAGKDLELLMAAANQSAISIENARLYQSEAEKLKIERDLDLARKIQQGLLPKCIPNINGLDICGEMIPAMQVGGDYYDLIPVSESELFVVVGDVSGKGLSASLYMTKLQTMIQLACIAGKTPKEILIEINKKLYEAMERNWFVTMTLALFNTKTKSVKYCRAGHPPLLVAKNGSVKSYKSRGLGVGLESGKIFESALVEEELNLTNGEIFVFFSDGIVEAMNSRNELFGDDNLNNIFRKKTDHKSTQIMDEVWTSIKTFRGSAEVNDDMTMVIVKVEGGS